MAAVPEGHHVLTGLTAMENLAVAARGKSKSEARRQVEPVLEVLPELIDVLDRKGGDLSGGQQQMLSIGQALVCEPDVLLIDELSLGLAPIIVSRLLDALVTRRSGRHVGAFDRAVHRASVGNRCDGTRDQQWSPDLQRRRRDPATQPINHRGRVSHRPGDNPEGVGMTKTVPIDEYISDEFYPGFGAGQARAPWAVEPLSPFQSGDEERFWLLDFHYPQGMVPLGFIFPEDGILWATQLAAHALPLPTGKGLAVRMVGPHVYSGQVEISSRWEVDERSQRVARNLPAFLERFEQTWADRVVELESGLRYFESNDRSLDSPETIGQYFSDAQVFFRRAWEIHFEMMYPLLATYVGFHGLCTQLGLDPSQISTFLQGTDSKDHGGRSPALAPHSFGTSARAAGPVRRAHGRGPVSRHARQRARPLRDLARQLRRISQPPRL